MLWCNQTVVLNNTSHLQTALGSPTSLILHIVWCIACGSLLHEDSGMCLLLPEGLITLTLNPTLM